MKKRLFILSFMLSLLSITSVMAQPEYANAIPKNATGEVSTEQANSGVQSYKLTPAGGNQEVKWNIKAGLAAWQTITKVTVSLYTGATGVSGQFFDNSGSGFKSTPFAIAAANTWQEFTYTIQGDITASTWGQWGLQVYNETDVIYIDDVTFYNAADEVVHKIDAADIAIAPTSITLTPNPVEAIAGKKQGLTVEVEPADASTAVSYATGDAAVATVAADGVVKLVGVGTTTITATSLVDGAISGSTTVNVAEPDISNSKLYAGFENGFGNCIATLKPLTTVVDNPVSNGNNTAKVLQVDSCFQYNMVSFDAFDFNLINTIKVKICATTDIADFSIKLGALSGTRPLINRALVANTWEEFEFTSTEILDADEQFRIQLFSAGAAKATNPLGYSFLIDSLVLIAGDGSTYVPTTGITISSASTITENDATLNLTADIAPANASNQDLTWSLVNATGSIGDTAIFNASAATITAVRNGTVTVQALTTDGGFIDQQEITISGQVVEPTALVIADTVAKVNDQDVQLSIESSTPVDADKSVVWSIVSVNDADTATISETGLLTPMRNGTVSVKAVSTIDASISATADIVISNQVVEATGISISSATTMDADGGQLTLTALVTPNDAANKTVIWTIESNDADTASLSGNILSAILPGTVTVRGALEIDATVYDEMEITIGTLLQSMTIGGDDITTNAGTSQMTVELNPTDADNVEIVWALSSAADSTKATISNTGLVTAYANGSITVIANDKNSETQSSKTVAISGQVLVNNINFTTANDASSITENGGSLQVNAEILPADARIKDFVWSVVSAGGNASVDQLGLVQALDDGDVYVKITAQDAGAYADSIKISISGQVIVQSVDIIVTSDTIKNDDGTLTLPINVNPNTASDTTVTWSIVSNDADTASINATTGLITAIRNGSIKVMAVANANSSLKDSAIVVIENQFVAPTAISLLGADSVNTITINDGSLQMSALVSPDDAVADVEWGISGDKFDIATITETGLVTAFRDGVVFVQATSTLAPTISGRYELTISNQVVEPTSLEIVSETGADSILVNNGTLSLLAKLDPLDAVTDVTWSIDASDTDTASISQTGVLTAIRNGKVTVKAISNVADTIMNTFEITIVNQIIEPIAISIIGTDSVSAIDVDNGTLALLINTTPADAVKDVYWSIVNNDADTASIDSIGIVTAKLNGIATVMAMSVIDSAVVDTFDITITNQVDDIVDPDSIIVKGEGGATEITIADGTLQMMAEVYPLEADSSVVWSIETDDVEFADISETGLLTATANGIVTVIATSAVIDSVLGTAEITISGQVILVSKVEVSSEGEAVISIKAGTLQLAALVTPNNATDSSVEWSVSSGELASVSSDGLVTAIANGTVTVTATAKDAGGIFGSIDVVITNQEVGILSKSINALEVYPNPVSDRLYVANLTNVTKVELISTAGAVLEVTEFGIIDVSRLNSGIYIIRAIANNNVYQTKFLKE